MSHPITEQITRVKNFARRLAISRGVASVLLVALGAGFVLATFDYMLRLEDVGTRVLLSFAWLAAVGAAIWFLLRPVWSSQWSDQSIARMLERRFPFLSNRLSSSLAFLQAEGESYGSKPLMRNVIAETTVDVMDTDLKDAVDVGPTIQILGWTAGALLLLGGLYFVDTPTTSKAIGRLLSPWRENPWPRVNHLAFVDPPNRIARGGDLRLTLVDESTRLPARVDMQIWYDGESRSEIDVVPMQRTEDQMLFERTNLSRSFKYRAVGGDDAAMKWIKLDVVETPQIVSGSIELAPPGYTGWLPQQLNEAATSLRIFEGTSVTFRGISDRRLKLAELSVRGESGDFTGQLQASPVQTKLAEKNVTADGLQRFSGVISKDKKQYVVPAKERAQEWIVRSSGEYSLSLTDSEGTQTVDADQWNVRMLKDERPSLRLIEPDAEELITPKAIVPVVCDVEDDLAVQRVELRYLRTDQSDQGEMTLELYVGPTELPSTPMPEKLPPAADVHQVSYDWSLESMRLPPGAVLSFHLRADDYKQQSNQTLARRLVVVSENELIDRAGRRQSLVLARLQQRLKQQRLAKSNVDAVKTQLEETKVIEKPTVDRLQSALLAQRQVNSALNGDDAEVTKELRRLKKMLERSQVGDVDVRQRIENTMSALESLGRTDLDPAIRLSTSAMQSLRAQRDQDESDVVPGNVSEELKSASQHQESAINKLEKLLDDMSAWDNYRRFAQELSDLLRQQRDVKRSTQEVAKQTLSRNQPELDGAARAAVRGAAARQLDLARRTDRTLSNLSKAESELAEKDPKAAQMVKDAMQAARDGAVSGKMREAGRQIDQNRLGMANQQQQAAEDALEAMLDELSRRSYSPEQRAEKLSNTGRELERLQKRQAELSREFAKANRERDAAKKKRELQRLAKRQKQVAQEAHKLERQLQRLRAQQSSEQTGNAAKSAEGASQAAEQGNGQLAQQQSQLSEAQMEQAKQSLQQEQLEAKSELAREQMVRLPQLIEALVGQQKSVVEEIQRLNDIRTERGELTSAQETSIAITAEAQRAVAQDTGLVAGQMEQLPVFVFALKEAQSMMSDVASGLDRVDTSTSTQALAGQVLVELNLIREMMEKEKPSQQGNQQQGEGQGGQKKDGQQKSQQGESPDMDAQLAQLKLLRGMQVAIGDETKQLNAMQAGDSGARQMIERRQQTLAGRQGQLGDIVSEMFEPPPRSLDVPQVEPAGKPEPAGQPAQNRPPPNLDALDQELEHLLQ